MEDDVREGVPLAGGRYTHKRPSVMGADPGKPGYDLVAFGYLIVDGDVYIGEGSN